MSDAVNAAPPNQTGISNIDEPSVELIVKIGRNVSTLVRLRKANGLPEKIANAIKRRQT